MGANHSWVEVYVDDTWRLMDPTPSREASFLRYLRSWLYWDSCHEKIEKMILYRNIQESEEDERRFSEV